MHNFDKMFVSFWGLGPRTPTGELPLDPAGGLPSFRPPHCPPLEKIMRAPMATGRCCRFPIYYSISKTRARQRQLGSKIEAKFRTFDPAPVKFRGQVDEMSESVLRVRPRTKWGRWKCGTGRCGTVMSLSFRPLACVCAATDRHGQLPLDCTAV